MNNLDRFINSIFWFLFAAAIVIVHFASNGLGTIILIVALVSRMNINSVPVWSLCGAGTFLMAYACLYVHVQESVPLIITFALGAVAYLAGYISFMRKKAAQSQQPAKKKKKQ